MLPMAAWCAAPDVDSLLRSFASERPATTPFVEVRFSKLLSRPLAVSGTLEHPGPKRFVRDVRAPFAERTEIDGDNVTLRREGQKPRRVSLQRAPELRALLGSFGALLAGDAAALERDFKVDAHGSEQSWLLVLEPRDAKVAQRVHDIAVLGRGARPRCIRTNEPDGDASIVALGAESGDALPRPLELRSLDDWCRAPER